MAKKDISTEGRVALLVIFPVLTVLSCLLHGWVLTKLWLWLVVPVFHVAPLPVAAAIGILLIFGYLNFKSKDAETSPQEEENGVWLSLITAVILGVFRAGFVLMIGYIVSHWIR